MFILNGKFRFITLIAFAIQLQCAFGQTDYVPYSYQFSQKFNSTLYSPQTREHTALKQWFTTDSLQGKVYDSLVNFNGARNPLLNGHLIDEKYGSGSRFYADLLPDVYAGRDLSSKTATWLTGIGAQIGGDLAPNFHYNFNFSANNGQLPAYMTAYANATGYIPGQSADEAPNSNIKDWYYTSFRLSYSPSKFVNFELGKDKNFIGDGYRSMMLSDFASNYPFFKTTLTGGSLQYTIMYAYLNNPLNTSGIDDAVYNKWGYFQFLDWTISRRLSLGLFENTMEATRNTNGSKQGFNPSLAMPFSILVPEDNIAHNPGKNLLGATAKYKIFNQTVIYGQFVLNEFDAKDFFSNDGSVTNKYGYQLGFRGAGLFGAKGLNYLGEFNTARPFTYSSFDQSSNYSQDGQPLADPLGAGFREWLAILNYSAGRFDLQGQLNYGYYGLDENGQNYGQNIFEPYTSASKSLGNFIGQGLRTDFYYAGGTVSYVINPRNNLRVELSSFYRETTNSVADSRGFFIFIGLRSSFRDLYTDF